MAIPLGIVGGSFGTVWGDRDRRLLVHRTRKRLLQWGYTPEDIPELFCFFDRDRDGLLTLHEFIRMINQMKLGISEERVIQLFRTFDGDGSGTIDDEEFVGALFPEHYAEIYRPEL